MAVRAIDGTWSKFVWNLGEKSESLARKFREGKACLIDLRLAVDAQPTLTPPDEWVSVEERLPENNAEVLMWRKKWKIAEAGTYRNACFWVYDAIGDSYKADDITYWMPLPAPPGKDDQQ